MWKRDQAVKPVNGQPAMPSVPTHQPTPQPSPFAAPLSAEPPRQIVRDIVNIGKSVVIKGELNGSEDLTIEGQVEGTIDLRNNVLTIGPNGNIKAQVFAKAVVVLGAVTGNITASEKVDIRDGGSVEGDLISPRVGISEGAHFRGSIDMQAKKGQKPASPQPHAAPASQPVAPMAAATAH
jgi:cytoskeletal protein CcmA (bactofilin family)